LIEVIVISFLESSLGLTQSYKTTLLGLSCRPLLGCYWTAQKYLIPPLRWCNSWCEKMCWYINGELIVYKWVQISPE